MTLYLSNTLTRTKAAFAPTNPDHVTIAGYRPAMVASFPPPLRHVIEVHGGCAWCDGGQVPA